MIVDNANIEDPPLNRVHPSHYNFFTKQQSRSEAPSACAWEGGLPEVLPVVAELQTCPPAAVLHIAHCSEAGHSKELQQRFRV